MTKLLNFTFALIGFFVIGLVSATAWGDAQQQEIEERVKGINALLVEFNLEPFDEEELRASVTEDVRNPQPRAPEEGIIKDLNDYDLGDLNVACELARIFTELPQNQELWKLDPHVAAGIASILSGVMTNIDEYDLAASMLACETVKKTILANAKG